jgi:HSP20 family protein
MRTGQLMNTMHGCENRFMKGNNILPLDIREDKENLYIIADVPGIKKEDLDLKINKDLLTISADRQLSKAKSKVLMSERCNGNYSRTVRIPDLYNKESVKAKLKDGSLTLTIPKVKNIEKEIDIN